jgi:RsiW-degrading membrane proteinase PrsW (M82 family)
MNYSSYSKYVAPIVEEILKASYLIYLIKSKKTGFLVDSAIIGFAVGAGFALVENIYFLANLENTSFVIWLLRGLGTAIMHGGTTAIFAMVFYNFNQIYKLNLIIKLSVSLIIAIIIHWFFNQFFFDNELRV